VWTIVLDVAVQLHREHRLTSATGRTSLRSASRARSSAWSEAYPPSATFTTWRPSIVPSRAAKVSRQGRLWPVAIDSPATIRVGTEASSMKSVEGARLPRASMS